MNEALLKQMLATPPRITHNTVEELAELEAMYHAVLLAYPCFGDTEVSADASGSEIYNLISEYFIEKEIDVELIKEENVLRPQYTHQTGFLGRFVSIEPLADLKETGEISYNILLQCVALVSKFCNNSINFHDWWTEQCEEMLFCADDEDDEGAQSYYGGALTAMGDCAEFEKDLLRILENVHLDDLRNITRKVHNSLPLQVKNIVQEIINRYDSWGLVYLTEPDVYDDAINFTEYCGFKIINNVECYDQLIDESLQAHFENLAIADSITLEAEECGIIDDFRVSVESLYGIIEAIGQTIQEVCRDAS